MRKRLIIMVIVVSLLGLLVGGTLAVNLARATFTSEGSSDTYLPVVVRPQATPTLTPIPTPTPMPSAGLVKNYSFENGWTDLPPEPGYLINQKPKNWNLSWLEPGELLYDSSGDRSGGVPECIHKLSDQLPPNEQPGGENALILDGEHVYKIFHFGAPFGAELRQEISDLTPGSYWRLIIPIQVHLHGDTDAYAAESGVWVNGEGEWANGAEMGDRQWYEHVVDFEVPSDGKIVIKIRVKSKWAAPKDFFIDFLH